MTNTEIITTQLSEKNKDVITFTTNVYHDYVPGTVKWLQQAESDSSSGESGLKKEKEQEYIKMIESFDIVLSKLHAGHETNDEQAQKLSMFPVKTIESSDQGEQLNRSLLDIAESISYETSQDNNPLAQSIRFAKVRKLFRDEEYGCFEFRTIYNPCQSSGRLYYSLILPPGYDSDIRLIGCDKSGYTIIWTKEDKLITSFMIEQSSPLNLVVLLFIKYNQSNLDKKSEYYNHESQILETDSIDSLVKNKNSVLYSIIKGKL
jgi:hypothetical protein